MAKEGATPHKTGAIPRRTALLCAVAVALVSACGSDPRDARTFGPYVAAIKSDTPAAIAGEDAAAVIQVRRSVALPLKARPPGLQRTAPYPGGVWFTPSELRVQLNYVITNLEDKEIQVELLVDGWNEFRAYAPQMRVVEEEGVEADRSCVQRPLIIPAKGRVTGTVSYDDFERMATALAIIMNNAPNPFHVLDPTVDLYSSPLAKPFIPSVISGISGFDLSLRSRAGAVRVAVEGTVDIIDLGELLMEEGNEGSSPNRRPQELIPVIAAPAM